MRTHAFNQIISDMKEGTIPSVVLLFGTEQFLVTWAREKLVEKYVNPATSTLDLTVFEAGEFKQDELYRLEEACSTFPMFSEKKVVVIEEYKETWNQKSEFLCDFVKSVPSHVLLIITAPAEPTDKRRAKSQLKTAIEKAGAVYDFGPLDEASLKKFISKRLNSEGKTMSPAAMGTLLQLSGYFNNEIDYALYNLENDVKKMMALAEGQEIREEDVINALSDNLEHNTFKMLDAISSNKKDTAFKLLHDMLLGNHDEFRILATIAGQLELMLIVKELGEQGLNQYQIAKQTKVHEYRIKKAAGFASSYTVKDLKRITKAAFEVENQIKSGLLNEQLALEMLIAAS
ncbi:MAG: DNA polymerase III subunit delta [Firmicutes bacterium]|nr:DNA polymerase III subunit delta [Bacillota bacterium]